MEKLCRAWTLVIRGCPSGQSSPSSLLCLVWQDSFMGSCCCCSVAQSCPILCDHVDCSSSGLQVPHHLLEFAQVHVHCIGDTVQPSHPLTPFLLLPSIFPSIRDFSNESSDLIRWPKYWSFSFSISPSSEYSGLIHLMIDWFDFFALQGTLRSLLQHRILKASVLWHSVFMVQLSQLYMTTGKTIALTFADLCEQSDVSAFQYTV